MAPQVRNKARCGEGKPREDRKVKCPVCDEVFKFGFSTSRIWNHLSKSHKIAKYNFLCYVCAQIFPRFGLLNTHLKYHANRATHKCLICGTKTTSVGDLKNHMIERHQDYKRRYVDCRLCRRYIRNQNFRRHLQEKHVETPKNEIPRSPSQRITKGCSEEPIIHPIVKSKLENIPKALEVGQYENPIIPALDACSGVHSSPQFGKNSYSNQTSLVAGADAWHKSQTTLMPGATIVCEYSLAISDSVLVISPDGNRVWLEWILTFPDVPPSNN